MMSGAVESLFRSCGSVGAEQLVAALAKEQISVTLKTIGEQLLPKFGDPQTLLGLVGLENFVGTILDSAGTLRDSPADKATWAQLGQLSEASVPDFGRYEQWFVDEARTTATQIKAIEAQARTAAADITRNLSKLLRSENAEQSLSDLLAVALDTVRYAAPIVTSGNTLYGAEPGEYAERVRGMRHWAKKLQTEMRRFADSGEGGDELDEHHYRAFVEQSGAKTLHEAIEQTVQSGVKLEAVLTSVLRFGTDRIARPLIITVLLGWLLFAIWEAFSVWCLSWQVGVEQIEGDFNEAASMSRTVVPGYNNYTIGLVTRDEWWNTGYTFFQGRQRVFVAGFWDKPYVALAASLVGITQSISQLDLRFPVVPVWSQKWIVLFGIMFAITERYIVRSIQREMDKEDATERRFRRLEATRGRDDDEGDNTGDVDLGRLRRRGGGIRFPSVPQQMPGAFPDERTLFFPSVPDRSPSRGARGRSRQPQPPLQDTFVAAPAPRSSSRRRIT